MKPERQSRGFVSHAATYAVGNVVRRLVGFLMLPIYTRFLSPADYGVVGLLIFAVSLLEPIFGARLGWAIPKFYFDAPDARSRRTVIWGALAFTGIASLISLLALVTFRGVGSELLFGSRKYAVELGLFSITLLSQPIESAGMTYIRLRERSRLFLAFSMSKLVMQLALNLLLVVYWRLGVIGVVLSTVSASILLGIGTTVYVAVHEAPAFDWQMTRRMVQFCWPMWLSALAGLYIGSSGAVYLRAFDSLSDVGRLQLALRFATAVGMLVWAPFFQHWEPMSFQYYKEANGKRKFQVAFVAMSALLFAGGLGVSIFSAPVIKVMSTKSFYAAAAVVPILTLGFVLNSLRSFFNFSFMATGHTKIRSLTQYVTALIITIAYVTLVPTFGLVGAACAQCLAFAASFVYVRHLSRRYYDPEIKLAPTGAFLLIAVVAYMLSNEVLKINNLAVDLMIKAAVMVIATVCIALIAIREVRSVDVAMLKRLPWPLHRISRLQLGRKWGV